MTDHRLATYEGGREHAELRLVQFTDYRGKIVEQWQVWSCGVCIATLSQLQIDQASNWGAR